MSQAGLVFAQRYGEELPSFGNLAEAESVLLSQRDANLATFLGHRGAAIGLDYSPESLKRLEKWYFEFGSQEVSGNTYSLRHAIGFYFGELLCRTAAFTWIVAEFAFEPGRYELGVKRQLLSVMLTKGREPRLSGNKRMESLWREYRKCAP